MLSLLSRPNLFALCTQCTQGEGALTVQVHEAVTILAIQVRVQCKNKNDVSTKCLFTRVV